MNQDEMGFFIVEEPRRRINEKTKNSSENRKQFAHK
ncbi:hypothetical protein BSNT_07797 [Bacillus subtilis subsp. natto BEST195]|nr:hypothetical protein BSNT_07797 [Bacillus subtilis subsp. natto BEST195]